jgi:hypothetical protein
MAISVIPSLLNCPPVVSMSSIAYKIQYSIYGVHFTGFLQAVFLQQRYYFLPEKPGVSYSIKSE